MPPYETAVDVDHLSTEYGVRWLVFDTNLYRPSTGLERLAPRRFSAGTVEVLELMPPTNGSSS